MVPVTSSMPATTEPTPITRAVFTTHPTHDDLQHALQGFKTQLDTVQEQLDEINEEIDIDFKTVREDISHLVNRSDSHYDGLYKLITRIEFMEETLQTSTKSGIMLFYDNNKLFLQTLNKISLLESKLQNISKQLNQQNSTIQTLRREIEYLPDNILNQNEDLYQHDMSHFEDNIKKYIDKQLFNTTNLLLKYHHNFDSRFREMSGKFSEMESQFQCFSDKLSNSTRDENLNIKQQFDELNEELVNKVIEPVGDLKNHISELDKSVIGYTEDIGNMQSELEAKLQTFYDKLSNDTRVAKKETTVMLCRASP